MNHTMTTAKIEADPTVPIIRITRDFQATPERLFRAHTDPELFARWVGPHGMTTTLVPMRMWVVARARYASIANGSR